MNTPSHVPHGAAGVPTCGTSAHCSIITNATTISCQKRMRTASLVPPNCPPSTAKCLIWCRMNICKKSSWSQWQCSTNHHPRSGLVSSPKYSRSLHLAIKDNISKCYLTLLTNGLPPGDLQLQPYIPPPEQRVEQRVEGDIEKIGQERVETLLTRITDAPAIMITPNPMAPRWLKNTKHSQSCQTRNKIPSRVPPIINTADQHPVISAPPSTPIAPPAWQSPRTTTPAKHTIQMHRPWVKFVPTEGGLRNGNIISQEATNFLT